MKKTVLIATKNIGKAKEFESLFLPKGYNVQTLLDIEGSIDVEETGITFEENAILKAETIARQIGTIVIGDDSGLIVDALDGRPGVYSARYAGEEKNDAANTEKVLRELKDVPQMERTARFYCALALASPNQETVTVAGTVEGRITETPSGTNGFGYDPVFFVEEKGKTMAELEKEEKNAISHRAVALKKLEGLLETFLQTEEEEK
ncbi:non-canonical purine NTP pyrophosphatase [Bacillus sp. M6-12]|uniref:XTP/dITP diphosphatase n=1 Tax=Bacillus sp. M6-12 TaxID=2054166 RepID=UPI000C7858F0|nr:XTP/dITP diphosphatase [Bacillus sp. M6-12]PLS16910.1 non-canonical purine NTP pyrophosphatase [Bacillus sp. M6-12]